MSNPLETLITPKLIDCNCGGKYGYKDNGELFHVPPRPFNNRKAKQKPARIESGFSYQFKTQLEAISSQNSNLGVLATAILNMDRRKV